MYQLISVIVLYSVSELLPMLRLQIYSIFKKCFIILLSTFKFKSNLESMFCVWFDIEGQDNVDIDCPDY